MAFGKKGWRKEMIKIRRNDNGKIDYVPRPPLPRDKLVSQMGFTRDGFSDFEHPVMGFKVKMSGGSYRLEYPDGRLIVEEQADEAGAEERFIDYVDEFMAPLRP